MNEKNNSSLKWYEFFGIMLFLLAALNLASPYFKVAKFENVSTKKCDLDKSPWVYDTKSGIPQRKCNIAEY